MFRRVQAGRHLRTGPWFVMPTGVAIGVVPYPPDGISAGPWGPAIGSSPASPTLLVASRVDGSHRIYCLRGEALGGHPRLFVVNASRGIAAGGARGISRLRRF